MKPLFDISKINDYTGSEQLEFECEWCFKTFYLNAAYVKSVIKRKVNHCRFCSTTCSSISTNNLNITATAIVVNCAQCNLSVKKQPYQKNKSKSGRSFCSHSCSAIYNNAHKTTGTRRSKLEKWLEEQLTKNYPQLKILYNNKEAINSELDIYIPSLNIAIELNGIFHYEPIYGSDKLTSIKNNDNRKFQACIENNIELVIIDASSLKYFKPSNVEKYYKIINDIIILKISEIGKI